MPVQGVNPKRSKPPACFYDFIINNRVEELRELLQELKCHADLDAYREYALDGNTGLLLAAQHGHVVVTELLLAAGADVNKCNQSWGCFPLLIATQCGHDNVVRLLLSNYADIELKDRGGRTPLMAAAENGHLDVVKTLVEHGSDLEAVSGFEKVPPEVRASMNTSSITLAEMEELKDPYKHNTTFLKACWEGHVKIVEFLINNGCKTDVRTAGGNNALHICALRGHHHLAAYLVASGVVQLNQQNCCGESALHIASRKLFQSSRPETTHEDPDVSDSMEDFEKFIRVMEVLIKAGCDIKMNDAKGHTVLYKLLTGNFAISDHPSGNFACPHQDLLAERLNRRRLYLIRLILSAVDQITPTDLPSGDKLSRDLSDLDPDLLARLVTISRSPRSLQHISRCKVRSSSPLRTMSDFSKLDVTPVMKDYLYLNGV